MERKLIWRVLLATGTLGLLTTSVALAASGDVNTVAGSGTPGFSGDGSSASSAQLDRPVSVVVDSSES